MMNFISLPATPHISSSHYLQKYRLFVFNFKLNFLVELSLNFIINAFRRRRLRQGQPAKRESVMNIPAKHSPHRHPNPFTTAAPLSTTNCESGNNNRNIIKSVLYILRCRIFRTYAVAAGLSGALQSGTLTRRTRQCVKKGVERVPLFPYSPIYSFVLP